MKAASVRSSSHFFVGLKCKRWRDVRREALQKLEGDLVSRFSTIVRATSIEAREVAREFDDGFQLAPDCIDDGDLIPSLVEVKHLEVTDDLVAL